MTGGDWLFLVLLLAGTALALVLGFRRGRLAAAALATTAVLAGLWVASVALTTSGWRDADGWVDCYPRCSSLQDATGIVLVFGGALAILLLLAALVAAALGRRR